MSPSEVDAAIHRLQSISDQQRALSAERIALVAQLPNGRTEGSDLAVYVRAEGEDYEVSVRELRRYVTESIIARCRVRRHRSRSAKLVPKAKPRKQKEAK